MKEILMFLFVSILFLTAGCTPKSLRIRKREWEHTIRMYNLIKKRAMENA